MNRINRADRWIASQHWSVQFGIYCLRVLLILVVLYAVSRFLP